MTRSEFLAELSEVRDQFDWRLSPCPGSLDSSSRIRYHIRAVPRNGPPVLLDPLGALCLIHHRTAVEPSEWPRAGELLGLTAPGEVVAAANDQTWAGTGPRREPIVYLQKLRLRLENAVGLGESEGHATLV